jgi:hypothetical protein
MNKTKTIIRAMLYVFMLHLLFVSCSDKSSPTEPKEEHLKSTYGIDYEHPEKYIISGTQSTITDEEFAQISQQLQIEEINFTALKKIYNWKDSHFKNINAGGKYVGKLTINDLLKSKELSGCHDHGLVLVSLLRKYNVPAIFVDATGIDWALNYPEKVQYFSGHVLVELFLDNKWILLDSTARLYIPDYDPTNPIIPITNAMESKGYFVMFKGLDPEDYGITDIQQLNDEQKLYATKIKNDFDSFVFPNYTIMRL